MLRLTTIFLAVAVALPVLAEVEVGATVAVNTTVTEQGELVLALQAAKRSGDQAAIDAAVAELNAYSTRVTGRTASVAGPVADGPVSCDNPSPWFSGDWGGDIQIFSGTSSGMAIDRDDSGGMYALVHDRGGSTDSMRYYSSTDGGVTWTAESYFYWTGYTVGAFDLDIVVGSDSSFAYAYVVWDDVLYSVRYNLPDFSSFTPVSIDNSSDAKSFVVGMDCSDVDAWPGDHYPMVFYTNNVNGFADSTAIWYRFSTDYGATWQSPTVVATHNDGDWDRVFDAQYGMNELGNGDMFFTGSRPPYTGGDNDLFFADFSMMPNPVMISASSAEDVHGNIAATHYGGDTTRIYVAYANDFGGDYGIRGRYSGDGGANWTYAGIVYDSAAVDDVFPDVVNDPMWLDQQFTFVFMTQGADWMVQTFWGTFPDTWNFEGVISGIHNCTQLWAQIPAHTGWRGTWINTYAAWTGFGPEDAFFDWHTNYTDVGEDPVVLPTEAALHAAYPNPFNPATTFAFDLPTTSHVRLDVYDVLGRNVATLVNGEMPAGSHSVIWEASGLGSGVYFAKMIAGEYSATTKVTLLK
jgi:hypothetical protein